MAEFNQLIALPFKGLTCVTEDDSVLPFACDCGTIQIWFG